jgi:hypothetical protein
MPTRNRWKSPHMAEIPRKLEKRNIDREQLAI